MTTKKDQFPPLKPVGNPPYTTMWVYRSHSLPPPIDWRKNLHTGRIQQDNMPGIRPSTSFRGLSMPNIQETIESISENSLPLGQNYDSDVGEYRDGNDYVDNRDDYEVLHEWVGSTTSANTSIADQQQDLSGNALQQQENGSRECRSLDPGPQNHDVPNDQLARRKSQDHRIPVDLTTKNRSPNPLPRAAHDAHRDGSYPLGGTTHGIHRNANHRAVVFSSRNDRSHDRSLHAAHSAHHPPSHHHSPHSRPPYHRSSYTRSPNRRSPNGRSSHNRSPNRRSPYSRSPNRHSPYSRSPSRRSPNRRQSNHRSPNRRSPYNRSPNHRPSNHRSSNRHWSKSHSSNGRSANNNDRLPDVRRPRQHTNYNVIHHRSISANMSGSYQRDSHSINHNPRGFRNATDRSQGQGQGASSRAGRWVSARNRGRAIATKGARGRPKPDDNQRVYGALATLLRKIGSVQ